MVEDVVRQFVAWSALRHAPSAWLDRYDLPSDVEPLCDWLFGSPDAFGWRHGSPELVLGAAPVLPVGADLFEIDEGGRWSVLQPVAPDGETILDLLAWHPCRPDRWRLLTGDAIALGEREIDLHDSELDGPLPVFATPLAWLQAGGRGVCLLRQTWQAAQRVLDGVPALGAETVELGEWLRTALAYRAVPSILVNLESDRAA
jgi:hypothetical protein